MLLINNINLINHLIFFRTECAKFDFAYSNECAKFDFAYSNECAK